MEMLHIIGGLIATPMPNVGADQNSLDTVLNLVFGITASIALLMIVIGGLKYITAHGDPGAVTSAKNTILYAIIGLLVTITAFSIVTFVINGVK